MRATAQDRDAAQLMGININTTIALTFLIGSALAGAAGFVCGVYYGTTWFFNGFEAGLKAFTAAVLGGIGNLAGAMLGGFLIGLVEAIATQYIPEVAVEQRRRVLGARARADLPAVGSARRSRFPKRCKRDVEPAASAGASPYLGAAAVAVVPFIDRNNAHVDFLANAGAFVLLALGLNIVVGFAGLLDLGYAAFFAIGSYSYAMLASQQFGIHIPFWVMLLRRVGHRGAVRHPAGRADAAAARRLPRDRDARLRRDRAADVPQPLAIHERPERHQFARSAFALRLQLRLQRDCRIYYVILVLIALGVMVREQPAEQPPRPRLDGDSRGRAGGAHMGINTTTAKLVGLRARRFVQRARRRRVRGEAATWSRPTSSSSTSACSCSRCSCSAGWGTSAGVIVGQPRPLVAQQLPSCRSRRTSRTQIGLTQLDFTNYRFMLYGVILVADDAVPAGRLDSEPAAQS